MLYTPTSMDNRAMCETDLWSLLTPTLSLIDTDCINVAQKLSLKKSKITGREWKINCR